MGKIPKWKILKTAMGAPYSGAMESYIRFGHGIDAHQENFELAKDSGLIEQKGSWFNFVFANDESVQGQEAAVTLLKNNKELYDKLLLQL